jgi:DNA (cytosine-5)-methyltransferase 1
MSEIKERKKWEVPELEISYKRKEHPLSTQIHQSKDAADLARQLYSEGEIDLRETFIALFLNRRNRVTGYLTVSIGGISGTVVDPKVIFSAALKTLASAIILVHNHPSGNLKPSDADTRLTKQLKEAGKLLEISVLDHVIMTSEGYYSFADEGLMGLAGITSDEVNEPELGKGKTLTHGSLFSGIGGFELAAKNAGIPTLWNCEIEKFHRKVLRKNFPLTKQYEDITKMKFPEYVDIISGGFPCQDISAANTHAQGITGKKSGLWKEMARIISETRPKYVIIENSSRLKMRGLEKVLFDLSEIGYDAEWECLQARQFGYPHKRERIFIVAHSPQIGQQHTSVVSSSKDTKDRDQKAERNNHPKVFEQGRCNEFIKAAKKAFPRMPQSEFSRMDDGVPNKLHRVGALGNAIVPAIAQFIFSRIMEIEEAIPNPVTKMNKMKELELEAAAVEMELLNAA